MSSADKGRVGWASRRGMLELDLLLEPFVNSCYATLSGAEQANYRLLLEQDDPDIYTWLSGRSQPTDARLASIVARIRDWRQ